MLPRGVPPVAPPFGDPNILGRERTVDMSLRELHPRCLAVSLWQNRGASCRSEKDSLRSWLRRRQPESKTAKQRCGTSTISWEPKSLRTYRTDVIDFQVQLAFAKNFCANARTQPPATVPSTSDTLFTFRKSRLSCSVTDISSSF